MHRLLFELFIIFRSINIFKTLPLNLPSFFPVKRPDQAYNQRPTLGNLQKSANHRNRQGYHYQPIASTSRQSPTFVLDDDAIPGPSNRSPLDYSSA